MVLFMRNQYLIEVLFGRSQNIAKIKSRYLKKIYQKLLQVKLYEGISFKKTDSIKLQFRRYKYMLEVLFIEQVVVPFKQTYRINIGTFF